ncbi:MAG TPA: 50S ribosomal protein L9 [Anaerolineae bacterium]|nr:50S ribosomal protein L9 [Anaerolineae bacterium]
MDVILLKDVARLGQAGEVCNVAPGYARNHLIPQGLAVMATKGAVKELEQRQQAEARRQKQVEADAHGLAQELDGIALTIHAKTGEKDRLYGSITSGDIAAALEKESGISVDRRKIELEEPIRQLGIYTIPVRLLSDVSPQIRVDVVGQDEDVREEDTTTDEGD